MKNSQLTIDHTVYVMYDDTDISIIATHSRPIQDEIATMSQVPLDLSVSWDQRIYTYMKLML